ncbi:uncharacterized protein METZ01_LOCUS476502 [marine metagenome]|uniref:Uncharacterized protein n=1 Tax=marine metagenome TaxID=408172 RepID=A0A383BW78_9ZZZZ
MNLNAYLVHYVGYIHENYISYLANFEKIT